jgi:hypothetical protein
LGHAEQIERFVKLALSTAPRSSSSPSECAAVASLSWRAVASLAAGSITRATIKAKASVANRLGLSGIR